MPNNDNYLIEDFLEYWEKNRAKRETQDILKQDIQKNTEKTETLLTDLWS
jgi:hypothetical protein